MYWTGGVTGFIVERDNRMWWRRQCHIAGFLVCHRRLSIEYRGYHASAHSGIPSSLELC
ncbi:hypothetical protein BVI434_1210016 [Burkholderia vietnamiensis]|nr:hypothetical protein BVI434_1210016 [Burkholderia vietnamiensis]